MAICDRCNAQLEHEEGYLFYSTATVGFGLPLNPSEPREELGVVLYCEPCTASVITPEQFRSYQSVCDIVQPKLDNLNEAVLSIQNSFKKAADQSIIERCLLLGLTPLQAKEEAKSLAILHAAEKDKAEAEQRAILYWKRDGKGAL